MVVVLRVPIHANIISSCTVPDGLRQDKSNDPVREAASAYSGSALRLVNGAIEGLTEADGEIDGLTEADGEIEADGDIDGLTEADGEIEADGDIDGLTEADGDTEADGEIEADGETEAPPDIAIVNVGEAIISVGVPAVASQGIVTVKVSCAVIL
jgi:hypothetical protein